MNKGITLLIAGSVIFMLGAFVLPIAFILPAVLNGTDAKPFLIPGQVEVEMKEAGRYYLWNDHQTFFEGKSYSKAPQVPYGIEIAIRNANGDSVAFRTDTSISTTSGSNQSSSIGYVELEGPEWLTISVTGDTEPQVFSFSRTSMMKVFGTMFGGIGISILVAIVGVGILIWGIIKLATSGKVSEPTGN